MAKLNTLSCWLLSLWMPLLALGMPTARDSGPLYPVDDPFYVPPEGFASTAPGTILRHRTPPYPIAAFGLVPINLAASHQILYRTTNSFGDAIATVSTILVPHNANFTKLLSYQVAEDAADPNCSPSYGFQLKSATDGILGLVMPQAEILWITAALEKGWVVTVPDHLGPKSAFLANNLSGHATLDNIRAALASSEFTNITSDATVTMWGYSGGSLATGFAAELQPSYAPELKLAGAALGGTVPKILPVIYSVNGGLFAGLAPAGIQGLANEYPSAVQLIEQNILPSKAADFNKTRSLCLSGDIIEYFDLNIFTYFNNSSIFTEPIATALLDANAMGQHLPEIPLYIYKSVGDEVSPVNETDALVRQYYCPGGVSVEYKRDDLSDHVTMDILGAPDAFMWLEDRMDGIPASANCSESTVLTSLTDPSVIAALGADLVDVLLELLSAPVGPTLSG
ncbi:hypothetical protein UA08_03972 [Talaromyces atroroseus]|uniref:Lipase A n=1 Tax=Talaromyces atroroseus TaxID=1441469 RepID=A0A1Q5Q8G8_TALAT|nr:hypothetical protein UA08_03972 [Talaromyces atroroseus]OKL60426.1 hypothetical protein UA08_03972 [Talaromyces atroroseus]